MTLGELEGRVSFGPVLAADFDRLADLRVVAMRESLVRVGRFDPERARQRLRSTFDPQHTRVILFDGTPVGFYAASPTAEGLSLDHLYIHPDFQGRGIGGVVLRRLFEDADRTATAMTVGALRESGSNRFYQRHGFERTGESEWDIHYVRRPSSKKMEGTNRSSEREQAPVADQGPRSSL